VLNIERERELLLGMFLKEEPIFLWNTITKYDSWQEMKMTKLFHENQEIVIMFEFYFFHHKNKLKFYIQGHN
jgi:hypothetical protein